MHIKINRKHIALQASIHAQSCKCTCLHPPPSSPHTHTLPPISSHIYQSGVRDELEQLNVLIISLDSWSAAVVKNETAISWPPVLLIRKRTILHYRMDWLPDAGRGKPCWCVCSWLSDYLYVLTFVYIWNKFFLFVHTLYVSNRAYI